MKNIYIDNLLLLLFSIFISEIILLGSGQSIVFFGLSFRYYIFSVVLLVTLILFIYRPIFTTYSIYLYLLLGYGLISLLIGLSNGADFNVAFSDFRSIIFLLSFFYFIYLSKVNNYFNFLIITFKYCCWILICFHFYYLGSILLGENIYDNGLLSILKDDVVSYPFYFFYNGFVFYFFGFWYYFLRNKKIPAFIFFFAIFYTFQRGMIASLFISLFIYYFINERKIIKIIFLLLALSFLIASYFYFFNLIVDRDINQSDLTRFLIIDQIISNTNFISFIIGHGLGIGIPIRPLHFENVYLEIFFKQGLIGLIFNIIFLYPIFIVIKKKLRGILINIFCYTSICFLVISFTNPFYQNPLGYIVVCIFLALYLNKNNLSLSYQ